MFRVLASSPPVRTRPRYDVPFDHFDPDTWTKDQRDTVAANMAHVESWVYIIRLGSRIKIGYTTNVMRRLRQLPYEEVLAVMAGDTDDERDLHRRFARHRLRRTTGSGPQGQILEWFADCPEIRAFASTARAAMAASCQIGPAMTETVGSSSSKWGFMPSRSFRFEDPSTWPKGKEALIRQMIAEYESD